MVLQFSKKNVNYTQQNIVNILIQVSYKDPKIYKFMNSSNYIVRIEGDIHRSQWTSDNTNNNYWLKIKIFDSEMLPIAGYSAIHLYLCFQTIIFDFKTKQYIFGNCINPPSKKNTDIANINNLNGFWSFIDISYGINPTQFFFQSNNMNNKIIPKKISKKLDIINPKTGKKINIKK